MRNVTIDRKYAAIFIKKAMDQKSIKLVMSELQAIVAIFKSNPNFYRFFTAEIIDTELRKNLIKKLQFSQITEEFIHILLDLGRMKNLPEIYDEMITLSMLDEGKIRASLISAHEMNQKDIETCQKTLEKNLGKKFDITHFVDSNLIGGIILKFNTMMYDASVKNVIHNIKKLRD